MTKYERHPAPEKLLQQITVEAVNLLALGTPDKPGDAALPEAGVPLIAKAWGLPPDLLDDSLEVIRRQKELVGDGGGKAALPDDQLLEAYDGGMLAELTWGLFETAIRLEQPEERRAVYELALELADTLDFDEWIESCGQDKEEK